MDKVYEIHQNFRIKYLVAGLVACLLAAGIFGCGKIEDTGQSVEMKTSNSESALKPLPTLAATVSPVPDKKESVSEVASAPLSEPTVSPVPTASPVPTKEPTPRPKGDFPERSYESIREFPYETMEFADEMAYAFIKQAYDAFAFDAEFKTGDPVLYDSYLDEFRKLVNNEMPFTVQGVQDSFYFKEYGGMEPAKDEEFKPEDFEYYVFDVNGDGTPELCVMVPGWGTYVFRYDAANSQMSLLLEMNYYEGFLGTGILYCNNFGLAGRDLNTVYHIDEKGFVIAKVFFCEEVFHSNGVETYMVALPEYINADESLEIPMEMKAMAYYSEEDGLYLFKVTARQYEQLNGDYTYVEGWAQADDEVEKMICTYEELFPEKSREETMAYMFRFLCPDQSVIKDLEIYTENDKMYYKWREEYASGEVSDPYVLESRNVTPDGLYHEYGLYHEIWNRNGEDRVHVRNDYHNWWFVNAQTLELVPWWMSNPEAEKEEDSVWENEKYFEIVEQLKGE